MAPVNRPLIIFGALLVVIGLAWPWVRRWPLFHLPGDIVVDRPGFRFYFPITTLLLLSALLTLISWILRK